MARDWEAVLSTWVKPASGTEEEKRERAERAIRAAIDQSDMESSLIRVYAKGSYANNTNVRRDSDIDIAVEFTGFVYYDLADGLTAQQLRITKAADHRYTRDPQELRRDVVLALRSYFGIDKVDDSGKWCIDLAGSSTRLPADVVPCYAYDRHDSATAVQRGTKLFATDGQTTINYPQQHLDNGVGKNTATRRRYKQLVRALKRLENEMVEEGRFRAIDSYLIECLVYNCQNGPLTQPTLTGSLEGTLVHLWQRIEPEAYDPTDWVEVNELKWLFGSHQKWRVRDARDFVHTAWNHFRHKAT